MLPFILNKLKFCWINQFLNKCDDKTKTETLNSEK